MKLIKSVLAIASALTISATFAQASGAAGGQNYSASFLARSAANVGGGAIYSNADSFAGFAARPTHTAPSIVSMGNWVAAMPAAGIRSQANYVNFAPTGAAAAITSLVFSSPNTNAFEISNVTAVPEPETYALMLAGIAALGFMSRRRKMG